MLAETIYGSAECFAFPRVIKNIQVLIFIHLVRMTDYYYVFPWSIEGNTRTADANSSEVFYVWLWEQLWNIFWYIWDNDRLLAHNCDEIFNSKERDNHSDKNYVGHFPWLIMKWRVGFIQSIIFQGHCKLYKIKDSVY